MGDLVTPLKTGQLSLRLDDVTAEKVAENEIDQHHRSKDIEGSNGQNDDHVSHEEEKEDEGTVEIGGQVGIHRVEILRKPIENTPEGHPVEELVERGEEKIADHTLVDDLAHLGRAVRHHQRPNKGKSPVDDSQGYVDFKEGVIGVFCRVSVLDVLVTLTPVLQPHVAVCINTHPQGLDQEDAAHKAIPSVVSREGLVKTESHLSAVLLRHHQLVRWRGDHLLFFLFHLRLLGVLRFLSAQLL